MKKENPVIEFKVYQIDRGQATDTGETRTGTIRGKDGEYLIVFVDGEPLPYKVHPNWII